MLPPYELYIFDELGFDIGGYFSLEVQSFALLHIAKSAETETIAAFVDFEDSVDALFELMGILGLWLSISL